MPAAAPSPARDQILEAAQACFAARGFAGTTIKHIAAAAGVNSALLYYYFRDKERLYQAALDRLVQTMIRRGGERLDAPGTPETRLRGFLELFGGVFGSHPHFYRLMLRELVDYAASHAVEQFKLVSTTMFTRLCGVIEEGQRSGTFRPELEPRFAAISAVATVAHFFTMRPVAGLFLGYTIKGPPPEVVRAYVHHAADFALAALATHPPTPARRRRGAAR
jgi:TetR/AcrR family transcriptional regulator